jgi:hypothetical protein
MQKEIVQEMGFLTEDDMTSVFKVTRPTLENWRRHGTGPVYAHVGNQFFYPIKAVGEFLASRLRNQVGQQ